MPNDVSTNDINKPKKGLLQSLHSLTFSDDGQDDEDATSVPSSDVTQSSNTLGSDMPTGASPSISEDLDLPLPSPTPTLMSSPEEEKVTEHARPVSEEKPVEMTSPLTNMSSAQEYKDVDSGTNLETIESSFYSEMRKNMESVKSSAENIKQKTNYELITSFGTGSTEVVAFNTFLTKEMPHTSSSGKSSNQRVNHFGVMTESGVYAIRASSAITPKLQEAMKFTAGIKDSSVGILGDGSSRRIVLKLSTEDYGTDNLLHIGMVTDITKQAPEYFTGLDAMKVDNQFIDELMSLAVSEVEAMSDYEKRRKANLADLQKESAEEIKKASSITDKLSAISL